MHLFPKILKDQDEARYGFLQSMIDAAADVILTTNSAGIIETCNKAIHNVFGYEPQDVIGRPLKELFQFSHVAEFEVLLHLFQTDRKKEIANSGRRIEGQRSDKSIFPISITMSELKVGGEFFILFVIRDISKIINTELELESTTRELIRSNSELDKFAMVVAHDLNSPLRTIVNFSESISKHCKENLDDETNFKLRRIVNSGQRMQALINNILIFSQIGKANIVLRPVSTNEILLEIMSDLSTQVCESKTTINISNLPTVEADKGLLRQVFQNLITNAIKFKKLSGDHQVHVSGEEMQTHWVLSVTDNGLGIESKDLARIFEAFQTLNSSAHYPGNGLGLSIVKKIIESLSGTIHVDSEPGKGSKFTFTIPKRRLDV